MVVEGNAIPLDFSNMTQFEPVPAGDYSVKVIESSYGTSKRASQPKWRMVFEVDEGEKAGSRLWLEHSLQDQALWAVARSIKALTGQEISSETGQFGFNPETFVGLRATAVVDIDDSYDGTPRNRVKQLRRLLVGSSRRVR